MIGRVAQAPAGVAALITDLVILWCWRPPTLSHICRGSVVVDATNELEVTQEIFVNLAIHTNLMSTQQCHYGPMTVRQEAYEPDWTTADNP